MDDGAAFTGTAGNDVFKAGVISSTGAAITTLNAGDVIDGGAGVDTLNLTATATNNNALVGTVKNIEKINITGSDFINRTASAAQLATIAADQTAVATAQTAVTTAQSALTAAQATVNTDQAAVNAAVIAQGVLNTAAKTAAAGTDAATSIANVVNALNAATNVAPAIQAAAISAVSTLDLATFTGATAAADALAAAVAAERTATADAVTTAGNTLTTDQGLLTTAQVNLSTAQGQLATAQSQLAAAQAVAGTATVDASFFQGSTDITVDGAATAVTNVTTQNVTFNGGANLNDSVSYDAATTAGNVVVNNSNGAITLTGAKLATENVSGSVKAAGTLTLTDGTIGGTIQTLNLNLSNAATVSVANLVAATTINASASTGDLTIANATSKVATLNTGSGNDIVTISTATSKTTGAVVNALVSTGAGNDKITVATSGDGLTTVSAGDGNDIITMAANHALTSSIKIDGGAGADTLQLANNANLIQDDYVLIKNNVSNVENLEFTSAVGGSVAVDGSQLTQFSTLTFDANSTIAKASEALVAKAGLTADAVGYVAADAATSTPATYAGSLNITAEGTGSTITAHGDSANVTVQAGTANVQNVIVTGDLKSGLTINTVNAANDATTPTADTLASANVTIVNDTATPANNNLAALTTLTLTGNGSVAVDNSNTGTATKLVTIDASQLGGTLAYGTHKGDITGGLQFTANDNVAETIKLGSGTDVITEGNWNAGSYVSGGSTYLNMDTIVGFDAVKETTDGKSTADTLHFAGLTLKGGYANSGIEKMTLDATSTSLDLAFVQAAAKSAADNKVVQFQFGDSTYLFKDTGTTATAGHLDNADLAIKLVGTVDLTTGLALA